MATTIPILWSDDIKVDIVSPAAILRAQTGPISQRTKGLLEAEVTTVTSDSGRIVLELDLIAPVLNGYRHRLLAAYHEKDLVYPVKVDAECFQPQTSEDHGAFRAAAAEAKTDSRPIANTEQEFINLVSRVLHSGEVRSIIQSLIARSNERRDSPQVPPESDPDEGESPD